MNQTTILTLLPGSLRHNHPFLCPNLLISVAENYVSECLPGLKRMLFKKCG